MGRRGKFLTYAWNDEGLGEPVLGLRVKVPLRNRMELGWVVGISRVEPENSGAYVLKEVHSVHGIGPCASVVRMCLKLGEMYLVSPRYFLNYASPTAKGTSAQNNLAALVSNALNSGANNEAEDSFIDRQSTTDRPTLVWTPADGSIDERVLSHIKGALSKGRSVIVTLPTMARVVRLKELLSHNGIKALVYDDDWFEIRNHEGPIVVLGPRSSIFASVDKLGLLMVVDPLDRSCREQQVPYYELWDVALLRAQLDGIEMVGVTSAPPLQAFRDSRVMRPSKTEMRRGWARFHLHHITETPDPLEIISRLYNMDLADPKKVRDHGTKRLLVVYNKSGFIRRIRCVRCKNVLVCEKCHGVLTGRRSHLDGLSEGAPRATQARAKVSMSGLRCETCGSTYPSVCVNCGSFELREGSKGTQKIAAELAGILPRAKVAEFDTNDSRELLNADVIVGTEAVVLGAYRADQVAFLDFDQFLLYDDEPITYPIYLLSKASEAVEGGKGSVHIQGSHLGSELLQAVSKRDAGGYLKAEFDQRSSLNLPPFRSVAYVKGSDLDDEFDNLRTTKPQASWDSMDVSEMDASKWLIGAQSRNHLVRFLVESGIFDSKKVTRIEFSPRGIGFL